MTLIALCDFYGCALKQQPSKQKVPKSTGRTSIKKNHKTSNRSFTSLSFSCHPHSVYLTFLSLTGPSYHRLLVLSVQKLALMAASPRKAPVIWWLQAMPRCGISNIRKLEDLWSSKALKQVSFAIAWQKFNTDSHYSI